MLLGGHLLPTGAQQAPWFIWSLISETGNLPRCICCSVTYYVMFCTALEVGKSKDFNWQSGFKQEAELYLSKFKWGKSFITLNHTMLDVYAACQGDSSAVVAAQNKHLEEARLEKESRYRSKYNRHEVFCLVWWLSIITWILSWLISVSFRVMTIDPCFITCYDISNKEFSIIFCIFMQVRGHTQAFFFLLLCQQSE